MNLKRTSLRIPTRWTALAVALLLVPAAALASAAEHTDPIAPTVLALAVILLVAKLGGDLASRFGQPAVLGELLAGVVLGNLALVGFHGLDYLKTDASVDLLARLGVLLLLFEIGLESTVRQMLAVGVRSFVVACLGVVTPLALGWGVGVWLLPQASWQVHLFLGATLTATSVGITARVLQDLGRSQSDEARVILGAAVIDDVLGLVVLAVVGGIITATSAGGSLSMLAVSGIVAKAIVFLVGSLVLGVALAPRLFRLASRLRTPRVLLAVGLAMCFLLAWLASALGLAAIVGAFAAGLILEPVHYHAFVSRGEPPLDKLIEPIAGFLAPIFFVVMGMRTDLREIANPAILGVAGALIVAAILGKQACSLGAYGGMDRLSVGIGMIPRGEVGLIFANIGLELKVAGVPIITRATYSAIVAMVIVTTVVTPPALKWSLQRGGGRSGGGRGSAPGPGGAKPHSQDSEEHSSGATRT